MSREDKIHEIDKRLEELPKGTLTYKTINGKKQPYLQRTVEGKSVSYYIKVDEREKILMELEERQDLIEQRKRLCAYTGEIANILKDNPYLGNKGIGIGWQDFERFSRGDIFYADKTDFIRQWWESDEQVSLIVRPRRFGKTLALSTVDRFFSTNYADRSDMFEKLRIWRYKEFHKLQGTYPVIFVTFLATKGNTFDHAFLGLSSGLYDAYTFHSYLETSDRITEEERKAFIKTKYALLDHNYEASPDCICVLSELLYKHHGKKAIILLDEYDTPVLEGYAAGFLDEAIEFSRQFINNTFKRNQYFEKAIITGTTKIAKNSLFSDMNNLKVITGTSDEYSEIFGFTEQEVINALKCQNDDEMSKVKFWYDGFNFGHTEDIYNPWSITNYLDTRQFRPYWINSSSNSVIGELIRSSSKEFKTEMEVLLKGGTIHKDIDENLAFQYLSSEDEAIWSLLLSLGYIKAENAEVGELVSADFRITNYETLLMFKRQARCMFTGFDSGYNRFLKNLLEHKIEELNAALNGILIKSVSYFDTGSGVHGEQQENFYHGLVLGLIASLQDTYQITSNRESGFGRYDIAMVPFDKTQDAFVMEFKVRDVKKEKNLEETVNRALKQIEEKNYEAGVLAQGFSKEQIYKLGFGFDGKEALVVEL